MSYSEGQEAALALKPQLGAGPIFISEALAPIQFVLHGPLAPDNKCFIVLIFVYFLRCGVSWVEEHVSLDCPECGGYSMRRPCVDCDGNCEATWTRDFASVSLQDHKFLIKNVE